MSKVAIVFWSGSGNTQSMANAVAEGVKAAGGEASVIFVSDFKAAGITLAEESLIVNETPDEAGLEQCREFGRALV